MEIVKNLVEEDIILSNHKLSDKEIIKVYSKQVKKLINRLSFEREKKNAVWDLYDQQEKELEIYKKAFEIAEEDGLNMEDYFKEAKEKINGERQL